MRLTGSLFKSAALALFLCSFAIAARADMLERREALEIQTEATPPLRFDVEVAANDEDRQTGLMRRETMPADHGMLFDFGETRQVYMWMKDTFLPLDMLFIGPDGKISHIKENALPLDESIIDSHGPVRFVLELNAGLVRDKHIAIGQRVTSPAVNAVAAKAQ